MQQKIASHQQTKSIESERDFVGVAMIHPIYGEILIKKTRKISEYVLAYFNETFCNIDILTKKEKS